MSVPLSHTSDAVLPPLTFAHCDTGQPEHATITARRFIDPPLENFPFVCEFSKRKVKGSHTQTRRKSFKQGTNVKLFIIFPEIHGLSARLD